MRHKRMLVCLRCAGWALVFSASTAGQAFAQDTAPQLVFTVGAPDRTPSTTTLRVSTAVEDRGLAMWSGVAQDFGIAVALSQSRWTLRSMASMTTLPIDNVQRPSFRQIEVVRTVYASRSFSLAGGGGMREDWDGTQTFIGRVLAGSDLGHGRLQGSLVISRSTSSPRVRHDSADVVTTIGWSRRLNDRFSLGVESIAQDLEGLWNPDEADGGARLVVGPTLQAQSKHRTWSASLTAGPVVHRSSSFFEGAAPPSVAGGNHFAIFASANWVPVLHR